MKKIFTFLKPALLVMLAVLLVTCGKKSSGDYRNLIPETSFLTISVNGNSLMEKAGFSPAERASYRDQAGTLLGFMGAMLNADDKEFILSLIDDFDNSGLSFSHDVYMFMDFENRNMANPDPTVGVLAKVGNSKKLGKLIDIITRFSPELKVGSEKGINIIPVAQEYGNSVVMAYDDNACLFYRSPKDYSAAVNDAVRLFAGSGQTLYGNKQNAAFFDGKSDVGVFMSYKSIVEMAGESMPMADIMSAANIYLKTDFKGGVIDTDYGMIFSNDEAKKSFEDFYASEKMTGKFADLIPDNVLAAFSGYLDGEKVYVGLSQVPQYSFLTLAPEAREIMSSLKGDMMFAFTGMDILRGEYLGILAATVSDPAILENLIEKAGGLVDIRTEGENSYSTVIGTFPVMFGIHDDVLYIANDPVMIEALKGKSIDALDNDIRKHFNSGYGAAYLNMNRLLGDVLELAAYGLIDSEIAGLLHFLNSFEDVVIYSSSPYEGKMIINMVDKDSNAVESMANYIRDIAMGSLGSAFPF